MEFAVSMEIKNVKQLQDEVCSTEEHRSLRGGTLATSGFFYNIEHGVAYVVGSLIAATVRFEHSTPFLFLRYVRMEILPKKTENN